MCAGFGREEPEVLGGRETNLHPWSLSRSGRCLLRSLRSMYAQRGPRTGHSQLPLGRHLAGSDHHLWSGPDPHHRNPPPGHRRNGTIGPSGGGNSWPLLKNGLRLRACRWHRVDAMPVWCDVVSIVAIERTHGAEGELATPAVEVHHLTKRYGDLVAVDGMSSRYRKVRSLPFWDRTAPESRRPSRCSAPWPIRPRARPWWLVST